MKKVAKNELSSERNLRITVSVFMGLLAFVSVGTVILLKTKELVYDSVLKSTIVANREPGSGTALPFPLGVNPAHKAIDENPAVDAYFNTHISVHSKRPTKTTWFGHAIAKLSQLDWYQNLASPLTRILVIRSGERKEEVIANFSSILRWDSVERERFDSLVTETAPAIREGKFYPGRYVVNSDASPEEIAALLLAQFDQEVTSRYTPEIAQVVPLHDTLTIASLLEREAYDFGDMRYIAGIIWNRLFIDMNLQLDASLQYVKGSNAHEPWWPRVLPSDKYLSSPFNTYENDGLPPAPIANPSQEAILAALNPRETDCLFYFHDRNSGFHCTETYEEHLTLLREYYPKE